MLITRHPSRSIRNIGSTLRYGGWGALILLLLVSCGKGSDQATPNLTQTPPTESASSVTSPPSSVATTSGLPTATLPPAWMGKPIPTPYCDAAGFRLASDPITYPGMAGRAWAADQLVVATVVEQSARLELGVKETFITTYSRLRVEERVRGVSTPDLLIVQAGGTFDGCTQTFSGGTEPLLRVGDRMFLFLRRSGSPEGDEPGYYIAGGYTGAWWIAPDGRIATSINGRAQLLLADLLAEARQVLDQPPPRELNPRDVIPLDRAPLTPSPTPAH